MKIIEVPHASVPDCPCGEIHVIRNHYVKGTGRNVHVGRWYDCAKAGIRYLKERQEAYDRYFPKLDNEVE